MNAIREPALGHLAWPAAGGSRVPYGVFTDAAVYELEQHRIFRGESWSFVALEAEIPGSGDYKATFVGDTPVVISRAEDGSLHAYVNRCAHRGAAICRDLRGNVQNHQCVYHQWAYDLKGNLIGVPFRRGLNGQGGMPADFDMKQHGLQKLRVDAFAGLVFATFSDSLEPLQDYLGPMPCQAIARIMNRPIKVLGDQRQYVAGNWKLYAENTRDPYHASLLHLFHCTFGLYRSSQKGVSVMDATHRHSMLTAIRGTDEGKLEDYQDMRSYNADFVLSDPSLLAGRQEFDDGVTLVILALFPNLVLQQISNTLAVRQIIPRGVNTFELVWTQFGYADDDAVMDVIRNKQGNLIGAAGFISMEDGEAVEIVHRSIIRDQDKSSYIAMGGEQAKDAEHLVTEGSIIGFWEHYREVMGWAV
jgi:anthranilate 1,2-dioxygenase large subunit